MPDQILDALLFAAGMTVLHSLWQGGAAAILLWAVSRFTPAPAAVRYALGYGLLVGQVLAAVLTFGYYYAPAAPEASELAYLVLVTDPAIATAPATPAYLTANFWLAALSGVWLLSSLVGGLRYTLSYASARQLRKSARPVTATSEYSSVYHQVRYLARRLGYGGRLAIGISEGITAPALAGHLRPVLLFPVAIINQLTAEEAEAVILHELAHLRRYDHLMHPLQCLIEVVFYYHPAIHWIGARVRLEREQCCDDLVLRHGPGRLPYARALLYFGERNTGPAAALSLADGEGDLLTRMRRLINNQETSYTMNRTLLLLPALAVLTLVASAAYAPTPEAAEAPEITFAPALRDTLPDGEYQLTKVRDGKTTRLRVADREIKELELDGKVIAEEDYPAYEEEAERLLGVNPQPARRVDTIISFNPRTYEADTTIIHGIGYRTFTSPSGVSFFHADSLRRWEAGWASDGENLVIGRALARLGEIERNLAPDGDLNLHFRALRKTSDSLSRHLAEVYRVDAEGHAEVLRQLERRLDTLKLAMPDMDVFNRQLQSVEQIEAQERALQEALRALEEQKKALKEREARGDKGIGYFEAPREHLMDREIDRRKAAARAQRDRYHELGRNLRGR